MKANLYINFYRDKNLDRQNEIDSCLLKNLENHYMDRFIIVISDKDREYLKDLVNDNRRVFVIIKEDRPTYNYYFNASFNYPDDINIVANTDIVIENDTVKRLKGWNWRNYCLALSRWDYLDDNMNKNNSKHWANRESQDVWMVKGRFKNIPEADFPLGKKGCDNRIAYLLAKYYDVINPSRSIRVFHYHLTNIRNYAPHGNPNDLIKPPYKLIFPTKLPQ